MTFSGVRQAARAAPVGLRARGEQTRFADSAEGVDQLTVCDEVRVLRDAMDLARAAITLAVCAALTAVPLDAQSSRDSAGVMIVDNTRPAWTAREQLSLAASPRLVIGDTTDAPRRFRQVRGVMRLSDGRVAVADGGSQQLRYFSPSGAFLSAATTAGDPRQPGSMTRARQLHGDTIVVDVGLSSFAVFTGAGTLVRRITRPDVPPTDPGSRSMMLAMLGNGMHVAAPLPRPAPKPLGTRWTDSLSFSLFAEPNVPVRDLGRFPYIEFEQVSTGPTQVWLSSIAVFVAGDDRFYVGFGDRYAIHVFGSDGKLQSIIRRAWTPTPITAADWEQWVVEWSKLWVKSSGAEREKDIQKVRDEPWAEALPAFSEFILDRTGRLWVRGAHWEDAIAAGSLTDLPAVPSTWSVFDTRGRWLGDVGMPANFQPQEIGADYVAGKRRNNGVNEVVIFSLSAKPQ